MTLVPPSVHRTADLRWDLPPLVRLFGTRPVLVTDTGIAGTGLAEAVAACIDARVVTVPSGEPQGETVAALARELSTADVVVALGGGSVLDTAKLAGRLVREPDGLADRLLAANPFPVGLPVVALPTTSGSGAEVTRTAVVTHNGRKTWAWEESLRPELAVLAPELCAGVPPAVVRAAGLDAFVHAVEAATGARRTPELSSAGFLAAHAIVQSLAESLEGDSAARGRMMEAATAAGVAIDHGGTGIGHAVGHALGSICAIPHGLAVMLGLLAGLEWTLRQAPQPFAGLAEILGVEVDELPERLEAFAAQVGFDDAIGTYMPPVLSDLAAEMLAEDHLPMRRNAARPITEDDVGEVAELVIARWSA
ncbi:MAG: iron-containing alcohol dehydrogenase [Acidimicrobiia bacterium]|nr:iron-containing alcohol dehydrogenase [Acidimicrobiia bacterium]